MDEDYLGWIKIHRKMLKWEWYDDPNTKIVFLHLLLKANYKEKKWHGQTIGVGEHLTSIGTLARETMLTVRQVRTALDHLKSTSEVTIKTTNKFMVVKLCNYGIYQELESDERQAERQAKRQASDKQTTSKRQANDKQATTPKEYKEINNVINKELNTEYAASCEATPARDPKHKFGLYQNVLLKDAEIEKLNADFGEEQTQEAIAYLDEYIEMKGYKAKSHYLAIRKWVFSAIKEKRQREQRTQTQEQTQHGFKQNEIDFDELERRLLAN